MIRKGDISAGIVGGRAVGPRVGGDAADIAGVGLFGGPDRSRACEHD